MMRIPNKGVSVVAVALFATAAGSMEDMAVKNTPSPPPPISKKVMKSSKKNPPAPMANGFSDADGSGPNFFNRLIRMRMEKLVPRKSVPTLRRKAKTCPTNYLFANQDTNGDGHILWEEFSGPRRDKIMS